MNALFHENQKLSTSSNFFKGTRGISADTNNKKQISLGKMDLDKLITQTEKTEGGDPKLNLNLNRPMNLTTSTECKEKVHSLSPEKKILTEEMYLIPPQPVSMRGKKSLILDLDETLIHSGFQKFSCGTDIILQIEVESKLMDIHVVKRPGVDEFLRRVAKCYEVIIFTASLKKYANPLIDMLDQERVCSYRFFREHCTFLNGLYVKELKRLNRNMKNVILLDNNPASYYLDIENGIPIKSFYDDKSDCELVQMAYVLEKLSKVSDVRPFIREIIYMNQINYDRAYELFHKQEYIDDHHQPCEEIPVNNKEKCIDANSTGILNNQLKILSVEMVIPCSNTSTGFNNPLNKNSQDQNNFRQKGGNAKVTPTARGKLSVGTPNHLCALASSKPPLKTEEKNNECESVITFTNGTRKTEESPEKRPASAIPIKSSNSNTSKKMFKIIKKSNDENLNGNSYTSASGFQRNKSSTSFKASPHNVKATPKNPSQSVDIVKIHENNKSRYSTLYFRNNNTNTTEASTKRFSSNNQSLNSKPSRKQEREDTQVRINPMTARSNGNYVNYKREQAEKSTLSRDKFNSLAFSQKDAAIGTFSLGSDSYSKHSVSGSLNRNKNRGFNTTSAKDSRVHSEVKIIKIIPNKSKDTRSKHHTHELKEANKTK